MSECEYQSNLTEVGKHRFGSLWLRHWRELQRTRSSILIEPIRLTSPSLFCKATTFIKLYVEHNGSLARLPLISTPAITCDHQFINFTMDETRVVALVTSF